MCQKRVKKMSKICQKSVKNMPMKKIKSEVMILAEKRRNFTWKFKKLLQNL